MMVSICKINEQWGYDGEHRLVKEYDPAPRGWIFAEPPDSVPPEGRQWVFIGGAWMSAPAVQPALAVPEKITTLQAELQLIEDGLLQAVNAAIEALPEPERSKANAKWHKSRYIYRADPLVEQLLVTGLGRTPEQVDQMFISAAKIV